jgi:hypothetical protein
VQWRALNSSTVRVSWKEPQHTNGMIKSYEISFVRGLGGSQDNVRSVNVSNSKLSTEVRGNLYGVNKLYNSVVQFHFSLLHPSVICNIIFSIYTRLYPKVSRLATWSENCKCYSSLPLGTVVLLFGEPV